MAFRAICRRAFLSRAAAAVALPSFVPRSAWASALRAGANDRIGVGYIGTGRRAEQLMGLPPAAEIVAVNDVYAPRVQRFAEQFNCPAYDDYRKLLDDANVDAVVIATPDHWHALQSIHACQAEKDVYCEKPITLTIREGRLMVEAARKYGCIFQTGSQQRSSAANRTACELIRNGRLGKIERVIAANYPSPWECALPAESLPVGLDWDQWCGPTDPVPYHADIFTPRANPGWISFRPWSGGEMTGWGTHGLDQIQWALGTDETGPVDIWVEGEPFQPPTYTEPESRQRGDAAGSTPKVFFRYTNGVVVEFANGPQGGGIFVGERGTMSLDRDRFSIDPPELAEEPLPADAERLYHSNGHMRNWIDCIQSRETPICDVEVGHRSTTLCHLGNIARWVGRELRWDPAAETFPSDAGANAYLERPMRAPYTLPGTI